MANKMIYLIDDDPINNMISTKIIQRVYPYTVIAFTDATIALDKLRLIHRDDAAECPDRIFLDINMPRMDGWEFLDEFQKLPEDILGKCKILMLSSSIDRDDIEKSKTYSSVREFISKPLTPDKLEILNTL